MLEVVDSLTRFGRFPVRLGGLGLRWPWSQVSEGFFGVFTRFTLGVNHVEV